MRADIAEQRVGLRWITGIGAGIVAILVAVAGFGFNMLLGMNADIAALQTDIAAIKVAIEALAAGN